MSTEVTQEEATAEVAAPTKKATEKKLAKKNRRQNALQDGVGAAGKTTSGAIAAGWDDWIARQDKSARKKKNGAIEDVGRNALRASSKVVRKMSSAPEDFLDAVDKTWTKSDRKLLSLW